MKTIEIAPVRREFDVGHCRVEVFLRGKWENFLTTEEWLPVADVIQPYAQWSRHLPSPMRVVTRSREVLCETKGGAR